MIRLKKSLIAGLQNGDLGSVQDSLQQAVQLEHATIPTYLFGLYSLDESKNGAIADIIQSVVVEEMLHMTLAANVLNAIGGTPQINTPDFIPTYPGPLPGGVDADLTVHLAPFSMAQLATFISIEQPEDPLNFPRGTSSGGNDDEITIGEFYQAIISALGTLPASDFYSTPRNQVGPNLMPNSVVVTDLASATTALNTIIEQGEGTSTSPEEVVGNLLAHYYRFMQIAKGRKLIEVTTAGGKQVWAYAGPLLPFDASGVYPVAPDPLAANYAVGSTQAFLNDNFNYTYTSLLNALHTLFSTPSGPLQQPQFNLAIGLMMSLKGQAKAMMSGIPDPTIVCGPSFQYQPVNPANN